MGELQSRELNPPPHLKDLTPDLTSSVPPPVRIELTFLSPAPSTTDKHSKTHPSYRVGTTSIVGRYLYDKWPYFGIQDSRRSSRMDIYGCTCQLDDSTIQCTLRDVDGYCKLLRTNIQRRRGLTAYTAAGILFIYDVSNVESWKATKEQFLEALEWKLHDDLAVYMLLGNKADKEDEREVEYLEAKRFADAHGVLLFEISAKDGTNVEVAIVTLIAQSIDFYQRLKS